MPRSLLEEALPLVTLRKCWSEMFHWEQPFFSLSATQKPQTPWSRSNRRRRHKIWLQSLMFENRKSQQISQLSLLWIALHCIALVDIGALVSSQKVNDRRQGRIFGGGGNFGQPLDIWKLLTIFFLLALSSSNILNMLCLAACMFFTLSTSLT